jgi:hypothetical protein
MFNSKALKEPKEDSRLYSWWLTSPIGGFYYDWSWRLVGRPIFEAKRCFQWWYFCIRKTWDFDFTSIFTIIEYFLKRLQKVLLNGHAVQEEKDMQALAIAIKLAGRLRKDEYFDRPSRHHSKKWGESRHWFEPVGNGSESVYMRSSRPNVNTEADKEQERKDFRATWETEEWQRQRDEKRLYGIFMKYGRRLWD